jgi:hypothetical protein
MIVHGLVLMMATVMIRGKNRENGRPLWYILIRLSVKRIR